MINNTTYKSSVVKDNDIEYYLQIPKYVKGNPAIWRGNKEVAKST
jgi:hypothetical protein